MDGQRPRRHWCKPRDSLGRLRAQQVPRPEPRRPGERGLDRLDQPDARTASTATRTTPTSCATPSDRREVRALLAHPRRGPDEKADRARRRRRSHRCQPPRCRRRDRRRLLAVPRPRRARRYAAIAGARTRAVLMTFAFGMDDRFVHVFDRDRRRPPVRADGEEGQRLDLRRSRRPTIDRIRRRPNTTIAVGAPHRDQHASTAGSPRLDRIDRRGARALRPHQVHARRPARRPSPVVVVGSANFSAASTRHTTRTCSSSAATRRSPTSISASSCGCSRHYAFRESLTFKGATTPAQALLRKYLVDSPRWIEGQGRGEGYFDAGSDRALRRVYFSGQ